MIGLGWDGFVCVMSDSISDLVVGNRDCFELVAFCLDQRLVWWW